MSLWLLVLLSFVVKTVLADNECPSLALPKEDEEPQRHSHKNRPNPGWIIAHNGASAHLPSHSLAAFQLAYELEADYQMANLVPLKDGTFVVLYTMDLNATTNIATDNSFQTSTSSFQNRTGYWTYQYDWEQLQHLNLLSSSSYFQNQFNIVTLQDLLQQRQEWIEALQQETPKRIPGIYLRLQDVEWWQHDTNRTLEDYVAMFLDQLPLDSGSSELLDYCQDTKPTPVPPLVISSFHRTLLQQIAQQWPKHNVTKVDSSGISTTQEQPNSLPPLLLFLDTNQCWQEDLWFDLRDDRDLLHGIAPHKDCLLDPHFGPPFLQHAKEYSWFLHPWTIANNNNNNGVALNESLALLCNGANGIVTELPELATQARLLECPHADASSSRPSSSLCYDDEHQANVFVGLAAFCMGIFITTLLVLAQPQQVLCRWATRRRHYRRAGARPELRVPTTQHPNMDDDDDDEML